MSNWPLEGGVTGIVSVDRNLRGIVRRGGELIGQAKGIFPQLAVPANRKLAFGTFEVEWPGASANSNTVEVTHGLGVTPSTITYGVNFNEASGVVSVATASKGSTVFKARAFSSGTPGAGVKSKIDWTAIG